MDIAIKQRLVGASVLIAVAVLVLPMLFGGRPGDDATGPEPIEISDGPVDGPMETRVFPIGERPPPADTGSEPAPLELPAPPRTTARADPAVAGNATGPAPAEPPSAGDTGTASVEPEPAADEPSAARPAAEPAAEAVAESAIPGAAAPTPEPKPEAPSAAVAGGRYMVQVASLGSGANAEKLSARLGGLGYAVRTDKVTSDVGTLSRVRVGPYTSEAEAERVVARLRQQIEGTRPRVIALQPDRAGRVTEPSDPLVRWIVQVGSFSKAENADNLVAKLRLAGHSAYREQVSGSGSVVYRVRVGPFVERDDAIRADRAINQALSLDGVVMSAD